MVNADGGGDGTPEWMSSSGARRQEVAYQRRGGKRSVRKVGIGLSVSVFFIFFRKNLQESLKEQNADPTRKKPRKTTQARDAGRQYFLDFGQSDFSYTTCAVCGLMYAKGQEQDQKLHDSFHKTHLQGIQFKGWRNERVAEHFMDESSRIIVVLPEDSMQHRNKVSEVAEVMEKQMGLAPGWLINDGCKVYLYICAKKVLGCAVVEAVEKAFRVVIPDGDAEADSPLEGRTREIKKELMFGNIKFVRQVHRKSSKLSSDSRTLELGPSLQCCTSPLPATLGVRGLWVMHSARRKGIATKLMNAVRKSFCGSLVDISRCAFSQPTADGRLFASRYCKTREFLVYF